MGKRSRSTEGRAKHRKPIICWMNAEHSILLRSVWHEQNAETVDKFPHVGMRVRRPQDASRNSRMSVSSELQSIIRIRRTVPIA